MRYINVRYLLTYFTIVRRDGQNVEHLQLQHVSEKTFPQNVVCQISLVSVDVSQLFQKSKGGRFLKKNSVLKLLTLRNIAQLLSRLVHLAIKGTRTLMVLQ